MRERHELISAFRRKALVNLLLLVTMIVLSAYLLQRALQVLSSGPFTTLAWPVAHRISPVGLELRYVIMTVVWPLVVGGLALAFRATHGGMQRIGSLLTGDPRGIPDAESRILAPVALPQPGALSASGRFFYGLLALLPLIALVAHCGAGFASAADLSFLAARELGGFNATAAYSEAAALFATTGLGIWWTFGFTNTLWPRRRQRRRVASRQAATDASPGSEAAASCRAKEEWRKTADARRPGRPWDVFLSAKNLDADGRPTRDVKMAEELYDFLTARDLNVFLSTRSLERLGAAAYKTAIDTALDEAPVVVAVGTSPENLNSGWVKYEWDSFFNDIISGIKKDGRVFAYVEHVEPSQLPRPLRQSETFQHGHGEPERLCNFIRNSASLSQEDTGTGRNREGPQPARGTSAAVASLWRRPAGVILAATVLGSLATPLFVAASKPYRMSRLSGFFGDVSGRSDRQPAAEPHRHNTGWVFLGYVDRTSSIFVEGPFASVAYRATGGERGLIVPRIGDVLRISKDRRVVIAGFRPHGAANELVSPPTVHAVLTGEDYTGQVLPKGSFVVVRDVDVSGDTERPLSVWCRVAACDSDSPGCLQAQTAARQDL